MRPFLSLVSALLVLSLGLFAAPPARADTFTVTGLVEDGYSGPAAGVEITLCEYDNSATGYSHTLTVPDNGVVEVVFPMLPSAVAFELEADSRFEDVHILVARPICPVSPCNPDQSGAFVVRLARRPKVPLPAPTFRPFAVALAP